MTTTTGRNDETKQLAYSAFWRILGEGKQPTVDGIMDVLVRDGHERRNRNVISARLKECWLEVGQRVAKTRTMPGIPDSTVDLVVALRDNMYQLAQAQFERDSAEIQRLADERVAEAIAAVTSLTDELAIARDELGSLHARSERLASELTTSNERKLKTQSDLETVQAEAHTLRMRVQALELEKQTLEQQIRSMVDAHNLTIKNEAERYSLLQKSLQQQLDDEKTRAGKLQAKYDKLDADYRIQSGAIQVAERAHTEARTALSAELGEAKGRANALALQVENLQRQIKTLTDEASAAAGDRARLAAELAAAVAAAAATPLPAVAKSKSKAANPRRA